MNSSRGSPSFSLALANGLGRIMALAPFRGKVRLTNWVGGLTSRLTPEAECQPVQGARVVVSLNDRIGRLMWTGCYELDLVRLLKQVLGPGMTFLDVGAQIGYFSVIAAALVGERGAVHSFEPDPDCFSKLVGNSTAYPWITAHHAAVADQDGEVAFYRSPQTNESGWGAIFNEDGKRAQISVRVCTLDAWRSLAGVDRIDFLKIDAEGAEYRVLEGARATIAGTRPVIWVEANETCLSRDAQSVSSLVKRLIGWNYVAQGVCHQRSSSFENIVAIPRERPDLLQKIGHVNLLRRVVSSEEPPDEIPILTSHRNRTTRS